VTELNETEAGQILAGKRVALVGKLGGFTKRQAQQLIRERGGQPVDRVDQQTDLVVVGADELPLEEDTLLDESVRRAAAEGQLEILSETQLWQRLGLFDEPDVQLYTPSMLADLRTVPVSTIRRWHRRKLIVPVREVHRLPNFDFQEVATARQLAQLLAAGASPDAIEKKLADLSRYVPEVERPLAQLSVIVEGKQLLLRQGEGLIEPGGQLRIDFDSLEAHLESSDTEQATLPLPESLPPTTPDDMLSLAALYEDEGQLQAASDLKRAFMAAVGPRAEICFELAELLYRLGDLSAARERYYMAIELDEDYVEARANLGCVLAETGQLDLAVAAFQGALAYHDDYPDVHYHLARVLDELGRHDEAENHWEQFLTLAPNSPWSEEARQRLYSLGKP
jgi:tetratricopeptide (TPR) repeat protein